MIHAKIETFKVLFGDLIAFKLKFNLILARKEMEAFISETKYDINLYKLRTKMTNEREKYRRAKIKNLKDMKVFN